MDEDFVRFWGFFCVWIFVFAKKSSVCAGAGVGGRFGRSSLCLKIRSHKALDYFITVGFTLIARMTAISIQTL